MIVTRDQVRDLKARIRALYTIIENQKKGISFFEYKSKYDLQQFQISIESEYAKLESIQRERDEAREELSKLQERITESNAEGNTYIQDIQRQNQELQAERDELQRELTEHDTQRSSGIQAGLDNFSDNKNPDEDCRTHLANLRAQLEFSNDSREETIAERTRTLYEERDALLLEQQEVTDEPDQAFIERNLVHAQTKQAIIERDQALVKKDDEGDDKNPCEDYETKLEIVHAELNAVQEALNQAIRDLAIRTAERNGATYRIKILEAENAETLNQEVHLLEDLRRRDEEKQLGVGLDEQLAEVQKELQATTVAAYGLQQEVNSLKIARDVAKEATRRMMNGVESQFQRLQDAIDTMTELRDEAARNHAMEIEEANTVIEASTAMAVVMRTERDAALETLERLGRTVQGTLQDLEDCREERARAGSQIERLNRDNITLAEQIGITQASSTDAVARRDEARREAIRSHEIAVQVEVTSQATREKLAEVKRELEVTRETLERKRVEILKNASAQHNKELQNLLTRSNAPSPEEPREPTDRSLNLMTQILAPEGKAARVLESNPRATAQGIRASTRSTRNPAPEYDTSRSHRLTKSRKRKATKENGNGREKKKK
ncbi:hypothetical protein EG329_014377 [Mollisiaceae sp. DMI_Dod_QoI]|nr:hypothetical protein EG329_014377 [Helotiales sp. DMI_Dod_QoI]